MDVIEPGLLFGENDPSPFEMATIDGRQFLIIRTASLNVSGASVHMELQEHVAYGYFRVACNFRSVDADFQFVEIWVAYNFQGATAIAQKAFEYREMCLCNG
jgi:hypothetical protein